MIKKSKILACFMICAIGIMMTGCSNGNSTDKEGNVINSSKVTLITKVLPYGEVGYAMVCDYGDTIDLSSIDSSNFTVQVAVDSKMEERTITRVYTNDEIALAEEGKDGQYLVIELDPEDENATTLGFDEDLFLNYRNEIDYKVTQKADVKTVGGNVFNATNEAVKYSNLITPIVDDFEKLTYEDKDGNKLNYRFFEPKKEEGKKYPLVLFLHGSGERGDDNAMQMLGNEGALVWAEPENQKENPAYILAPQAEAQEELTMYWTEEPNYSSVLSLLKETIEKYDVDENRVYVIGMSNGGIGTWNIIEKNPGLFAAAVPICGVADIDNLILEEEYKTLEDKSILKDIKDMPIWVFHAEDDPLVDVRASREAVKAIQDLGGKNVKYTEYPEGTVLPMGHFSWVPALQDKEMIEWMFEQSK